MSSVNKVMLMGNLTRDPQLTYLPSQTPVVEFGLAMNRKFKKQDGSQGEEVCFVDCQMFGKRAEALNQWFKKGAAIFIEGRLKFDSWQKDGQTHSKLRVLAEEFQFLPSGGNNGGQQPQGQQHPQGGNPVPQGVPNYGNHQPPQYQQPMAPNANYIPPNDDIPF